MIVEILLEGQGKPSVFWGDGAAKRPHGPTRARTLALQNEPDLGTMGPLNRVPGARVSQDRGPP